MRGGIDGLATPHPLVAALPALMQDDDFTVRWMAGLDDVLAPVLWTLDSLESYFDPMVAPDDFVDWLGGWVGAASPDGLDDQTRRALAAETAALYGMRGTLPGLRRFLELTSDATIASVEDGGGVSWARDPSAPWERPPGRSVLVVTVVGADDDAEAVRRLVAAWCPAHVAVRVEVESA